MRRLYSYFAKRSNLCVEGPFLAIRRNRTSVRCGHVPLRPGRPAADSAAAAFAAVAAAVAATIAVAVAATANAAAAAAVAAAVAAAAVAVAAAAAAKLLRSGAARWAACCAQGAQRASQA